MNATPSVTVRVLSTHYKGCVSESQSARLKQTLTFSMVGTTRALGCVNFLFIFSHFVDQFLLNDKSIESEPRKYRVMQVPKHTSVQLRCSANAPPAPPSPPPPSPGPPPSPPGNTTCSGPHGAAVPAILRNRPSGTALPDFLTLAAPFTPFNASGGVDTAAVSALAQLFKRRLGITAVWVMGMRGQFDTLTVQERKEV